MKKTSLDNLILGKALRLILDVDSAVNVKYGNSMFCVFSTENGIIVQELPENLKDNAKEGFVVLENRDYGQVFSQWEH
jgi:hypothetical protein